jgi:hypothetical protein
VHYPLLLLILLHVGFEKISEEYSSKIWKQMEPPESGHPELYNE